MLHVLNEYHTPDETPGVGVLTIRSAKQGDMRFLVNKEFIPALTELRWCYEQDKAQVYHTDTTRRYTSQLELSGTRLYLWKYILWMHHKKTPLFWHRTAYDNYLLGQGICGFK